MYALCVYVLVSVRTSLYVECICMYLQVYVHTVFLLRVRVICDLSIAYFIVCLGHVWNLLCCTLSHRSSIVISVELYQYGCQYHQFGPSCSKS